MEDTEEGKLASFWLPLTVSRLLTRQTGMNADVCGAGQPDIHERRVPETLTAPTITSGGNPPAFSLTPDES